MFLNGGQNKISIGLDLHNLSTVHDKVVRTGIQQVVFYLLEAQQWLRNESHSSNVEIVPLPMLPWSETPDTTFSDIHPTHVNNSLLVLQETANELNIASIVEAHTSNEAEKALNFDKAIIGINNRNLKNLKTDIITTLQLHKILSSHSYPIISESGIKSEKDVKEIIDKTGIMNFLIGESLLENIEGTSLLKKIVKLTNKISTFSRL